MSLCKDVNSMLRLNPLLKILFPVKRELFQVIRISLEAPIEGKNSKASKLEGQMFFKNCLSKASFLVSCRHTMSQKD
jgi:hypothetical protein